MGLDISIIKPIETTDKIRDSYVSGNDDLDNIRVIDLSDYYPDELPKDENWMRYIDPFVREIEIDIFDLDKIRLKLGISDSHELVMIGDGELGFSDNPDNEMIIYEFDDLSKVPTTIGIAKILSGIEISYQRKGANSRFYDEDKWPSLVWSKEELNEYRDKYFSHNLGKNNDTEYNLSDEEMRSRFEKNIMSKFSEGFLVLFD